MTLDTLPLRGKGHTFRVVVESPRGSTVKLVHDPALGAIVFQRALPIGHAYPYDWGFFPSTRADDGDPLDAMVLFDTPTYPGIVIETIPIGVVRITQRKGGGKKQRNDRVLAVPSVAPRYRELREVPRAIVRDLETFFVTIGRHGGKHVVLEGWEGAKAARRVIEAAAL